MRAKVGEPLRWLGAAVRQQTDDCIVWPFARNDRGYGQIRYGGRVRYAHHAALELVGRSLPPTGMECRHLCGTSSCVNPRHIAGGTSAENRADQKVHGREARGSRHANAKLSEADVRAIRKSTETNAALARRFGVSRPVVSRARRGLDWSWLR